MSQYKEIKSRHPDCLLFFRLGDFYEMFFDDAVTASKELDLTLTTRDRGKPEDERTPMCGVPYHTVEPYIARLISKGYKIAICEQLEEAGKGKKLVDRDLVRIITPGTVIESSLLDSDKPNYLAAVYMCETGMAAAFTDISTGEIFARAFPPDGIESLCNEISSRAPAEIILNLQASENEKLKALIETKLLCSRAQLDENFSKDGAEKRVLSMFNAENLEAIGLDEKPETVLALSALIRYVNDTQCGRETQLSDLELYSDGRYMELDSQTIRNLELFSTMRTSEKRGSLLWAMRRTKTPMGGRLLTSWMSHPLLTPSQIELRLSAVEELFNDNMTRPELVLALKGVGDIERLISKISAGTSNARDLNALKQSISVLPEITDLLKKAKSDLLLNIKAVDTLTDVYKLIDSAIDDDTPVSVRNGGMIRAGYDERVDHLRSVIDGGRDTLAEIEAREKTRTGKKLKIGYNKVFGYYIEIPRSQSSDVPEDYVRKQTLVNCERFITQELKSFESEFLSADDNLKDLEYEIFSDIAGKVAAEGSRIKGAASLIAILDVLCSFAENAVAYGWVRPQITENGIIDIKGGRHPVVEATQRDTLFVPNDTYLDCGGSRLAIITGPNMAGKSTYMRQTALIVLMAQMGCFVPARSASIGIVDRVFTRIGASDDLAAGQSTFMVEMSEVADILRNATERSLIILDEIGRGTSTYDGMSIARAVVEYCAGKTSLGAKTMFSTHYHELTALEGSVEGVKNYNITAKKRGDDIIFLRRIIPGGADDSYGIEVAHLAGLPDSVVKRAKQILAELTQNKAVSAPEKPPENDSSPDNGQMRLPLPNTKGDEIIEILNRADIDTMTPLEALNLVYKLKRKVDS